MGPSSPAPDPDAPLPRSIVGYVTVLRPAPAFRERYFLHAGDGTYQLEMPRDAGSFGGWVKNWRRNFAPVGPAHLLEVRGVVQGGSEAPVLRAESAEYLGE